MKRFGWFLSACVAFAPAIVVAQTQPLIGAIQAGQVGERYDGYMGFAITPTGELRRQVTAVNIRRRNLYIELAERRNVTAEVVGLATGCELMAHIGPGQAYMLKDGAWRRRAPGQSAPAPDYCR